MGTGDNARQAAENALRDVAGLSDSADDAHAPEPGAPQEKITVHSSISEGSNAAGASAGSPLNADDSVQAPGRGTAGNFVPATAVTVTAPAVSPMKQ